jgi:hypothetical protein
VSVTTTATYSIVCSAANGQAIVSWTAPTQNTDNTPLLDLRGFKIFHATTVAGLASATPIVINDPLAVTYTITGLPSGARYYAMKAFNSTGVDSDMSPSATNVVVIPASTATANVTITTKPKPPVIVTVNTVAYAVQFQWNKFVMVPVGTVPLNIACVSTQNVNNYNVVPRANVKMYEGITKPNVLVAECAPSSV